MNYSVKQDFIEFMIRSDVLRFGQFKTKSGRLSPYFINTGNYRTGAQIGTLGSFYATLVQQTLGDDFDALFGPAYKGIALAASTASCLYTKYGIDKPYFYNRKEVKDHGEGGSIVGYMPKDGDRIIIIEDVITAGTAVHETIPLLKSLAKVSVTDMFISVDRCEIAGTPEQLADPQYRRNAKSAVRQVKEEFGLNVHSLVTFYDLLEYMRSRREYAELVPAMEEYARRYAAEQEE